MNLQEKINYHFKSFPHRELFQEVSILILTKDGQVLGQLGKVKEGAQAQSLGALMVGMWQASEAVAEMIKVKDNKDTGLNYQDSSSGFFLLQPTEKNPKIFWSFIFENQVNPGKIKNYARQLRTHFNELEILKETKSKATSKEEFLFENVTEEEVDNLFSFAGI